MKQFVPDHTASKWWSLDSDIDLSNERSRLASTKIPLLFLETVKCMVLTHFPFPSFVHFMPCRKEYYEHVFFLLQCSCMFSEKHSHSSNIRISIYK